MTQNNPQTEQTNLDLLNLKVTASLKELDDMKKSNTEPLLLIMQYFDTILATNERNFWENSFLITNNTTKLVDLEKNQQEIRDLVNILADLVNILDERVEFFNDKLKTLNENQKKLAEKKTFWEEIKGIFKK